MHINSRAIAAVGLSLGTALVVSTAPAAAASASSRITGGNTTIALTSATLRAVHGLGAKIVALSPAREQKSVLTLPTTGGTAAPPNYLIKTAGGFSIGKGAKTVKVTNMVMNTESGQVTADVTGKGTVVVMKLGQPNAGSGAPGRVQFSGFSVTLTATAITLLDKAFRTTVFKAHPQLGTAATTIRFKA